MWNSNNNQKQWDINIYCVIWKKNNEWNELYNWELLELIEKIKKFEGKSLEWNLKVK